MYLILTHLVIFFLQCCVQTKCPVVCQLESAKSAESIHATKRLCFYSSIPSPQDNLVCYIKQANILDNMPLDFYQQNWQCKREAGGICPTAILMYEAQFGSLAILSWQLNFNVPSRIQKKCIPLSNILYRNFLCCDCTGYTSQK
jgi:hypothetical protein